MSKQSVISEEAAVKFLQVSRTTLWRLRRSGALPYYRVGGKVRYQTADLRTWLKGQREANVAAESLAEYVVAGHSEADERRWSTALEAQDWSFHDEPTGALTHAIHPYPAKFPPQIPARLIEILTTPGEIVLDPFCGSGTTLVEALKLDRSAIGTDVNPIAILVSEAKTLLLTNEEGLLEELEQAIESDCARERGEPRLFSDQWPGINPTDPPRIPNIERWFTSTAVREIGLVLARIGQIRSQSAKKVGLVALSSILVAVSNQDSETRYTARPKVFYPGDVLDFFARKLREICNALLAFRQAANDRNRRVFLSDARQLDVETVGLVDAVITSPPYANAFDYHLYHRHRMYWLGHDPGVLRELEIGSHLNNQRRGQGIEAYRNDMRLCLKSLASVLKPRRPCAFVVGDSVFFGKVIDNAKVIVQVASEVGFRCISVVERRIHPVKRSMIRPARRARIEKIILLVRA